MPTSRFTVVAKPYTPRKGDFICLPFADGKTPAFPQGHAPRRFTGAKPPKKPGGGRTAFVGELSGQHVAVRLQRLDAPHTTPARALKKMVAAALAEARGLELKRVVVVLDGADVALCDAAQEGALLGGYTFDRYLKKQVRPLPVQLVTRTDDLKGLRAALADGARVAEYVNVARDVLNEPSNVIFPQSLAALYTELGTDAGLAVSVWDEKQLAAERCEGILSVGRGSADTPRLVIGEYAPEDAVTHLALVGKGVTFDTGGYCLKPPASQIGMKMDMGGAAMMFSAACAIAALELPVRVSVYTPLVVNDISSTAYRTTDILTLRSGRTVQVDNTDAEGRLILADALDLACEHRPDYLIDSATLTGACVVALGQDIAAAYGTDPEFTQAVLTAGREVGEDLWELPLHQPYREQLKTAVADCANVGERWGGSITAALFLQQFVRSGQRWTHLDIAGPGTKEKPLEHLGTGAKGFGVKTIVALARALAGG